MIKRIGALLAVVAFAMVATWIFEGEERKFGLFLALVGTIGILVGALQLARGVTARPATRTRPPADTPPPPPPPPSAGTPGV